MSLIRIVAKVVSTLFLFKKRGSILYHVVFYIFWEKLGFENK